MNRNSMKALIASFAIVATVVAGTVSAAHAQNATSWSDEQIVRGVVFGQGPFAAEIETDVALPESLSASALQEYAVLSDRIVADLLDEPSRGTASALRALRSGDPYRTLDGFSSLRHGFADALVEHYPEAAAVTPEANAPRVCGPTVCAAAIVLAIAVGTAIAAVNFNVAGNVNMVVNQNGLWTNNGVWNSRSAESSKSGLPTADPAAVPVEYPRLVETEVAARVAAVFAGS